MLVSITGVTVTKAPKGYSIAEVKYQRDGKEETRKIMSFSAEAAYTALAQMTTFPQDVNVVMQKEKGKDGKEYWNWKAIEKSDAPKATSPSESKTAGKVVGSNYETPAERARRQTHITRQATLNTAIAFAVAKEPKGISLTLDDIKKIAKELEQHVVEEDVLGEIQ